MLLNPSLAILDETDSGLDVDAVRLVSKGVEEYQKNQNGALLIITHSTRILDALHVDYTHIMVDGKIVATGDGSWLIRSTRKATNPLSVRRVWQTPELIVTVRRQAFLESKVLQDNATVITNQHG